MSCPHCDRTHRPAPAPCLRGVVLVCGGRDYANAEHVFGVLDELARRMVIEAIRHGACSRSKTKDSAELTGVDRWADEWAISRGVPVQRYPADWRTHGRAAGPIRNLAMLREPVPAVVIAFPGGAGTAHMTKAARGAALMGRRPCSAISIACPNGHAGQGEPCKRKGGRIWFCAARRVAAGLDPHPSGTPRAARKAKPCE